ncbi:MAG: hypothetical protein SVR08_17350 [Spirochaetota bacterium]|nr:hypothetical protein [Spirochaetota bacterium]
MKIKELLFGFAIMFLMSFILCSKDQKIVKNEKIYKEPKNFNFKFIGYDININNPEKDRRSYYQVFIDKIESGRTTIGLESQLKTFEYKIDSNRHLLMVKKWALDEKKGKYYKLNNIEQPKPNYIYFNMPKDKVIVITLVNDVLKNISSFKINFEFAD